MTSLLSENNFKTAKQDLKSQNLTNNSQTFIFISSFHII